VASARFNPGLRTDQDIPAHEVHVTSIFVLKNVTSTVTEEAACWARKKAAEENTSVSKLVGRMLENQMRMGDEYKRAIGDGRRSGRFP
jgi:Glu-tRNA(Gln) amidotransferase subunit E-like FAD-binding protein